MRRLVGAALALLLLGCQPLPHPFEDDRPAARAPIMSLPDTDTILVSPVAGLDPDARQGLAHATAEALQANEILASDTVGNRGSLNLLGTASASGSGVKVDWRLIDPAGKTVGTATSSAGVSLDSLNRGDPAALKALAMDSASAVSRLLGDDRSPPAPSGAGPSLNYRQVTVVPVTGAPGDGKQALTAAMTTALKQARLTVVPGEHRTETLSVVGTVSIDRPQNGHQHVAITWALLQPDGKQLGIVKQENAVPQGSLDGRWGEVANAVAQAAAPGILALIEKAEQVRSGG
ncbi:MAG TPA: hypothetical protein VK433_10600 [Stellaceae bacterium]|nr:hypothetical protein [Stellaceae bacterium]